ncbi:hypothetical protein [Streptomyces sp. SID13726]|uniref:hypothetical protein n=1 Tax=Streptomyces sp. SID13726 TaxID=2706058 RepID=UPI0013BB4352|nr:hypothetical protein [Streptomyces sp. SID13726]NEA98528.1 hypothetical protein [Streptomyces sp. SID13726]
MGVLLVLMALAAGVGSWFAFTSWLPADVDRYRDYTAASPCPERPARQAVEDCVRTVTFTVEDVRLGRQKKNDKKVTLSGAPFWNGTVSFGDTDPLLPELSRGDQVTGTVWRGTVTMLTKGELRQNTSGAPRDEPQMVAAIGTSSGLLAILALAFGTARLAGRPDRKYVAWKPYGKRLVITLASATFAVGLPLVWLGVPWWLTPVGISAVVACGTVLIYRWDTPSGRLRAPVRTHS